MKVRPIIEGRWSRTRFASVETSGFNSGGERCPYWRNGLPVIEPFTDIVNALRQLRALLKDLVNDAAGARDSQLTKRVRQNLRKLYFEEDGMLGTLTELQVSGDISYLQVLDEKMQESADSVKDAIADLLRLRDSIGYHSMVNLRTVDELISNRSGKKRLRWSIDKIIESIAHEGHLRQEFMSSVDTLVSEVSTFNKSLEDFHDRLNH